ncbi:MAG: cobalamin biosynthesis protein CbiX [Deltaproteobacteria bacterium]|jgi:sirohydrochlorin ferrochelatase|nr:cobalamin biosynthesis protein CbiX [Deltaproteobacteria bacterium]
MRAIVLVDHGSREPAANEQLDRLARLVAERRPDDLVRAAHMELAPPSLAEAIDACIAAGAREVDVHPFFVAPGRHVREDIPRLVAEAGARHAGARIRLSEPLGLHPSIVDAVLARLAELDD